MDEHLLERAQSAETRLRACQDQIEEVKERHRQLCDTFGITGTFGGNYRIDFERLANALGFDQALELRKIIDTTYNITGNAGEKPRVSVRA